MKEKKSLTYLITGGAGFIGSHLSDLLLAQGHRVLSVDNLSTGRLENIAHLQSHPQYQFARADILETVVMDRLASESDIIVHLAAAVGVNLIVDHPVHTIETNIMGTEAVLKVALRYGCRVLIASTSEVYGKGIRIPFAETDDVLLGSTGKSRWAYAASKMVDEFFFLSYQQEYGLDVIPFRLFNTVGPRQTGRYGMVIPRFVAQALTNEPITVYGDGTQSRCFCDVRDVVQALTALSTNNDAVGKLYNIGNTEEISMNGLAERIRDLAESESSITLTPYTEAYGPGFEDMQRRVPDISRINALIGWQPTRSLDDILLAVIDDKKSKWK